MSDSNNEFSLRRSISNTLRKSSLLKNAINNNKNSSLKKFVPNIYNLKSENKPKIEETYILETFSDKNIQELIKKNISIDLQKEAKREKHNHKVSEPFSSQNIDISINNEISLLNLKKVDENNNNVKKEKSSIDIYELNNISKNIFYNKKCASPSAHFLPLTLPFFNNNEKQKKVRNILLNKDPFFFYIQLPNMLPAVVESKEREEKEEEKEEKLEKKKR